MIHRGGFHFPLTYENVLDGEHIFWFSLADGMKVKHGITSGYYATIQQLLDYLNKI